MYDEDELIASAEGYMWEVCVRAVASGEMSINEIHKDARNDLLKDVEHFKLTGEINID